MTKPTRTDRAHLGVTVGAHSLYAHWMGDQGQPLDRLSCRLNSHPESILSALTELKGRRAELLAKGVETVRTCVCLGTRERLRFGGKATQVWSEFAAAPPLLLPALSGAMVGALPRHPGLLVSLGEELRLAALDGGLGYREVRWREGGALWWLSELERLAPHSKRLTRAMSHYPQLSPNQKMAGLPELLSHGQYPAPDPVLKLRLDKIVRLLAERLINVAGRLPGVFRVCLTGYLTRSAFGALLAEELQDVAAELRLISPRFPPEVGASLLAWAFESEEAERRVLGKECLAQELNRGRPGRSDGRIPQALLRRLQRKDRPLPKELS